MPSLLQPDNNNERHPSGNEEVLARRQVVIYAIQRLEQMAMVSSGAYSSTPSKAESSSSADMSQAAAINGSPYFRYENPLTPNLDNNLTPVQPTPDFYNQSSSIDFAREKVDESLQEKLGN